MNAKLESKSQEIVKRCEEIKVFEHNSFEVNKENLRNSRKLHEGSSRLTDPPGIELKEDLSLWTAYRFIARATWTGSAPRPFSTETGARARRM